MRAIYLTPTQLKAIKDRMPIMHWQIFAIALETGMRIGDIVKLKCRDIKPDGVHYKAEKTGKRGIAQISATLRRQLMRKGDWLFPSPYKSGQHITRQAAWQRIKRACKQAGIEADGISPHSLRKVFAVETYREKGFAAAQKALQHANAATTEIYAFADWATGENAEEPLTRRDLTLIIKMVLEAIDNGQKQKRETKQRPKA